MNDGISAPATDIPRDGWVERWAPGPARPYLRLARLDRPIGTWLLLIPCWWGQALATPGWPDVWTMALFAVGALAMRGAGCTVNDLADRDFDRMVARTADRPIASGRISVAQGVAFLAALSAIGLWVLVQFNAFAIQLGVASLALIVVYPFMKRITYWPQLFLGFTFNWGVLVGWAVVTGGMAAPALWLYAAGIFWTLGYDTIYAHQDKADDIVVGVKSTALKFGAATPGWLVGFYTATASLLGVAGWTAGLGWPFAVGLAAGAAHLAWQVRRVDLDDPKSCLRFFKSNRDFGLIVLCGIVAGRLLAGA
ncbi:MAG: 4-hydroxybenzoate octaprenyltransferase [Rhodospirillaceae bacterium]